MPPIYKKVKEKQGYACDVCLEMISDGQPDGLGGVNWWGMCFDREEIPQQIIELDFKGESISYSEGWPSEITTWRVCKSCGAKMAKLLNDFVEDNKKEREEDE